MGGAAESAWGAAIGNSIAAIVWWMQLHVALRHKTSAAPAEEAEAAPLQSSGDFAN
jgi:hypothetical protein